MSTYPNLNIDPELLKIKTKGDEIKELKYRSEKHDHENILKSLKIDNEYYKKSLNKKKILLIITEILVGSASTISTSTMGLINPGAGIIVSSSTALLTSIAILITNEYISKLKIRYTKLKDWISIITLLYEKALRESMIDKKIDQKGSEELKKIYNHYLDKRKEIMKNTQFKVEDVFGDVISKDNFSQEQITKLNNFLAKIFTNINISIKFNFFNSEKKSIIETSAPPLPIYDDLW